MQGKINGSFMVSQVIKNIVKIEKNTSDEDNQSKGNKEESLKKERRIILAKKQTNFYRRITKLYPTINNDHIYRLFGFFGINQKTLEDPDHKESVLSTYFSNRIVDKVQFFDHAIVIELAEPSFIQPDVEYLIERYKSKGNKEFFELAESITEVMELYRKLQEIKYPPQKADTVKKWLDHMGDTMFIIFLGPRKQAISKSLLNYLGYDIEELAVEMAKYRHSFLEIFSFKHYMLCTKYFVQVHINAAKLALGQISFNQFKKRTTFKMTDFIIGKDNVRSYCDISFYFLNAEYFVTSIDFIYYKTDDNGYNMLNKNRAIRAIEIQKDRIHSEEFMTMKKVKKLAQSQQSKEEKQLKTAGYKEFGKQSPSIDLQN